EDTDNGSNRVRLIAPTSLSADVTVTLPSSTGTLAVDVPYTAASSSGAASLDFKEDTDNGTSKAVLQGPASLSSDVTITLPGSTGTLALIDVEDQVITGGARVTIDNLGNLSGQSITPDPGDRPM